ncbi:uncharacterized protein LOC134779452 isoform X1 [Penaeus indicus]|uniref:uncharacterized protein LOC134779452 isoform X1 n=1 Tax=Penaeus indicus TaxID=29960 RepID=UPI00300D78DA
MKFVCAVWFILALSFHEGVVAADDESVIMFINEISHALQSQWEILEKIRYHTLVNKLWLKHLLAELNKIEGKTRVNRRSSLNGEELLPSDDFLHSFREIIHELEDLQLMLNTTDGLNATAFSNSNYTDALGTVPKNASLNFFNVETPNNTSNGENNESKEGFPTTTTTPTPDIVTSSTSINGDAMTMSTTTMPDMPAVIATLEKLNLLLIDHIMSIQVAATTNSPPEDFSNALTSLKNMYREHFGQLITPDVHQTTTEHPTVHRQPGELTRIIESLRDLASYLKPRPSQTLVTNEANATTAPTSPATCEPPLQEIAYRMCILVVKDKRLNWHDAGAYCRARGGQLAQDSVVIKTRRYLNEFYGEEGLRVRWPFWVGGHEVTEEGAWRWEWTDGSVVSSFLWSHKQPRYYSSNLTPRGSCMILDGFQAFYGGSLPCHLRRRFVCQMWK